jgi:hypothetical protein
LEPAGRSTIPPASKPEEPCPKRSRRQVTIVVSFYGFVQQAVSLREEPSRHSGIKQKTFRAMERDISAANKDIHAASDEKQVKIRRKLKKDS